MDNGAFIMHRVGHMKTPGIVPHLIDPTLQIHGTTTDINKEATRAVTKMKATITQRFNLDGVEADAESDCRFVFFFSKDTKTGDWGANYVRHFYEKDKLIPVNPEKVPKLDAEKLKEYPTGYRYLAYCQELTMGVKVVRDLPGHRRDVGTINGAKHDTLYLQIKEWMDGKDIDF